MVTINCISENKYSIFDQSIDLSRSLGPGEYTFPFSFKIPEGAPASFNWGNGDEYARIRYTATATYGPSKDTEVIIVQ